MTILWADPHLTVKVVQLTTMDCSLLNFPSSLSPRPLFDETHVASPWLTNLIYLVVLYLEQSSTFRPVVQLAKLSFSHLHLLSMATKKLCLLSVAWHNHCCCPFSTELLASDCFEESIERLEEIEPPCLEKWTHHFDFAADAFVERFEEIDLPYCEM